MSFTLRCPVCRDELTAKPDGARCVQGHHFDRARQGYLNLLPVHKKRSANPGDNVQMVEARSRFLNSGLYQTPATALVTKALASLNQCTNAVLVDAGCGEGYYTQALHQALADQQPDNRSTVIGFDISRAAIQHCCRRSRELNRNSHWLVASVADIPLLDQSVDIITCVFSRIDWQEFARILKPGGQLLVLNPGAEHLWELRQHIYTDVRPYPEDKLLGQMPAEFVLSEQVPVEDQLQLATSATILDLLAMTPHYWHIKPEQRAQLETLQQLSCRLDMRLYRFTRQP